MAITNIPIYDIVQDPVSGNIKMETNPAYQVITSHQVKMETNPAYQEMPSDKIRKGPDPAYQEISTHSGRANVSKPAGTVNHYEEIRTVAN